MNDDDFQAGDLHRPGADGGGADRGRADEGWADGGWADGGWADGGWADGGWDAVVLAGGRAERLGGIDKTALVHAGRTLLEHALDATAGAGRTVVVGPAPLLTRADRGAESARVLLSAQESPAFSGPASALAQGLRALAETARPGIADRRRPAAQWVAVLAADQPRVAQALPLLLHARREVLDDPGIDGVIAEDTGGNRQPLLALYRVEALNRAVAIVGAGIDGCSMRTLLAPLMLSPVHLDSVLCVDVDTAEQAATLGIRVPAAVAARVLWADLPATPTAGSRVA